MNETSRVIATQVHTFRPRDLVGGHAVIDLVNTVNARDADPVDWLDGYPRLLEWAALTGSFDPGVIRRLGRLALRDPTGAARALRRVRALREGLLEVLTAIVREQAPSAGALQQLERSWKDAVNQGRLEASEGRTRVGISVDSSGLAYLEHELALRSIELLQTLPRERTRVCAGPRCGWLFIDRSKGGRRRWCDMATCGNAAKSRRHYRRTRVSGSSAHKELRKSR